MNILFLGPECYTIQAAIEQRGHSLLRIEEHISPEFIVDGNFDFAISYRYRKIIKKNIIEILNGRLINLHISLLPWNKGADPNLWSWLENTPKGVTIHKIDEGLDTGDILLQQQIFFDEEKETLRTSYSKLSHVIENLFIDNIDEILASSITAKQQKGKGTHHFAKDKAPYVDLYKKLGWDTPVRDLIGKAGKKYEASLFNKE